ncbi:MAG: hypothetical protein HKN16_07250 [Saprospiraceae bacterium]|nr:hypothetical protein [Saprospiraceae bacterium]
MGVVTHLEELIRGLGENPESCQMGPNHWEIPKGSAVIRIVFHPKSGLIMGESSLCKIPKAPSATLFEFLLSENDQLEGLSFCIQGDTVLLSFLMEDRFFEMSKGRDYFSYLLESSDYYDNILVERFGAVWLED